MSVSYTHLDVYKRQPIYIALLKRKDLSGFRGKVMPVLAILCSLFMVFAAIYSHKMNVVYYLCLLYTSFIGEKTHWKKFCLKP